MTCPLGDGAELRPLEPWQAAELAAHIDQERADRRFDLAFSDSGRLTRDHEVLGVCREAESVVPPRRYANVAEAAAALRELSRR